MKSIPLKDYEEGIVKSTTRDILTQIIDHSKSGSITTSDQRKRMRLLDIMDASEKEIQLEDADFDVLKGLVDAMVWSVSNKIIRQFLKDIDGV